VLVTAFSSVVCFQFVTNLQLLSAFKDEMDCYYVITFVSGFELVVLVCYDADSDGGRSYISQQ